MIWHILTLGQAINANFNDSAHYRNVKCSTIILFLDSTRHIFAVTFATRQDLRSYSYSCMSSIKNYASPRVLFICSCLTPKAVQLLLTSFYFPQGSLSESDYRLPPPQILQLVLHPLLQYLGYISMCSCCYKSPLQIFIHHQILFIGLLRLERFSQYSKPGLPNTP